MRDESGFQLTGTGPQSYERSIVVFMAPFVDALVEHAKLKPGDAVLDVACGTGFVARAAAPIVGATGRIAGLDINADMLEIARAASVAETPSIQWHHASVDQMPFPDATFDAVLCSVGIMFFPDLRRGLAEMHRVTAPGGRVAATFWAPPEQNPYMAAWRSRLEAILPKGSLAFVDQAFHLDRDPTATAFRAVGLRGIIAETVGVMVSMPPIATFLPGHMASLPCRDEFEALDPSTRQRLYEDITNDLAEYIESDDTIRAPFALHLVAGTRP